MPVSILAWSSVYYHANFRSSLKQSRTFISSCWRFHLLMDARTFCLIFLLVEVARIVSVLFYLLYPNIYLCTHLRNISPPLPAFLLQ